MSKIEWTDITWNPVTGCSKISAGCQNCYAERMANRLQHNPKMGDKYENGFEVTCHPEELKRDFGIKPKKIFVCSMGDLFHKGVPFWFIGKIIKVIRDNPQHVFQILTKRPETMMSFFSQLEFVPKNAWLGITAENWEEFPGRSWYLNEIRAAVKFISIEPLLEDIASVKPDEFRYYLSHFDWVIVGAETGPGARYMNIEWAQKIRHSCWKWQDEGPHIPFFFKKVSKGDSMPDDLNVHQFPEY